MVGRDRVTARAWSMRAARASVAGFLAGAAVLIAPAAGSQAPTSSPSVAEGSSAALDSKLSAVETFAFAIGGKGLAGEVKKRFRRYDLVVADGEEGKAKKVAALRARGKIVLGYLSVGTIENWRSWYPKAKRYRLDREPDWRGEWYADASAPGYRALIAEEVAPAILAKGFDGLFLDNTDMVETHPAQRQGMTELVTALRGLLDGPVSRPRNPATNRRSAAGAAGGTTRFLFAQNGDATVADLLPDLDGWNREDVTRTYDFDRDRYRRVGKRDRRAALRALREIAAAGKLTTTTDYTRRRAGRSVRRSIRNSCRAGAIPFVSDIELSRIPRRAPRC